MSSDTKVTIPLDPKITPPYTKVTMTSDPIVTPSDARPITTQNVRTTPSDQASFASLPREIRDKIYRLALPHSRLFHFISGPRPLRPSSSEILSPSASTSTYANEACEMLLKRNGIRVDVQDLQLMLGEDGTSFLCDLDFVYTDVVSLNCIDVKLWLRGVVVDIQLPGITDELACRVSVLLECPGLQWVEVVIDRGYGVFWLKRQIGTLSCAFKALAEKFGQQLTFYVWSLIRDVWTKRYENFVGDLEELEIMIRDGKLDTESEGSDLEEDEE